MIAHWRLGWLFRTFNDALNSFEKRNSTDSLFVRSIFYSIFSDLVLCMQRGENTGHRIFRLLLQQMITPDGHQRLLNARGLLNVMQDDECTDYSSPLW